MIEVGEWWGLQYFRHAGDGDNILTEQDADVCLIQGVSEDMNGGGIYAPSLRKHPGT